MFLTTRYLERVNDIDTNASKEFILATRKGIAQLIAVVLDAAICDLKTWANSVVGYHLGDKLYIDFSSPEKIEQDWVTLCEKLAN